MPSKSDSAIIFDYMHRYIFFVMHYAFISKSKFERLLINNYLIKRQLIVNYSTWLMNCCESINMTNFEV